MRLYGRLRSDRVENLIKASLGVERDLYLGNRELVAVENDKNTEIPLNTDWAFLESRISIGSYDASKEAEQRYQSDPF
ncbi:hypothetical protein JX265_013602 [Neoarthrinium moseri]|uniref:Uncharacterized protein n=1 Tax=Neoarthrinium moseri TaxID=1658444 RepID=A0A9P9W8R8_9PEZI|nr:uncharacterized protein JN550_013833 [Neoarthrinium moseri]KAI1839986.1 hypothetical protein JX266_013815 [Neoarthrinium moseri]KAI1849596.1 hypothetical protein JX265_013602 [Neoarthrinium moseri]KAI1856332.1 hypothetical protein JN550_013833 [Neoarthrinium moseri]